ncbi:Recombinase A [Alkalidesulfovibrio alkalitolerans DSM 16529]|jgi:tripartite-type tricarboxylate transporter receptor subunit TctC|uniref:Recombinase A n=1 Tax=Alkalidesulfovibrio alkalitolerans DSM 16529 TaxID=1121439 RepID=S7TFV0_9BACT|nr:tripartite tricarboxylate transporter substrate binding protein [Alkalidesulfovibrio alkalitolerans]EPR35485.1 Recombinase A [Alkalidesulfovibrio alkalitolerans DSM 16529]
MRSAIVTLFLCVFLAGMCLAQPVQASNYPERPIKMLTMTGPGAQIDLLTRALSDALSAELGKPVLVTNMPGGSHGSVMAAELKASDPDGYTLAVSATAAFTYSPHYVQTRYTFDDFEYLSMLGLNQSGIVCAPNRPWTNLKEAFEWARNEKRGLTYMFQGSDDRDVMQRIAAKEGVSLSLMPSTGGPSIISAVMGGHVDLGHLGAILFEYVKANRLKLLAATTPQRLTQLQDVPTLREQGWDESVEMFVVLVAPKGLPAPVLDRLNQAIDKVAANEKFRTFITDELIMAPVTFGREAALSYMKEANDRFGKQAAEAKKQ